MQQNRRKQFTFYASYFDAVMDLPKRRQWPTMLALIRYALEAAEPDENSLYSSSVFKSARPNIDSSRSRAEAKLREQRSRQSERFPEESRDLADEAESAWAAGEENKNKKKNKNEYEDKEEREEEHKKETKKKNAPLGALTGAKPPREALSPALSEREALDDSFFTAEAGESEAAELGEAEAAELGEAEAAELPESETAEALEPGTEPAEALEPGTEPAEAPEPGAETPEPRGLLLKEPETLEPYASMLREDGALTRAWEQYRQRGADGLGPPSGAEKFVVLSTLAGISPSRRASNLCARMARSAQRH